MMMSLRRQPIFHHSYRFLGIFFGRGDRHGRLSNPSCIVAEVDGDTSVMPSTSATTREGFEAFTMSIPSIVQGF